MKLKTMSLTNFGSYDSLDHDFTTGLSLVHGATGAGKSTLLDGPMWVLFGETSKNGGVDDIRSWKCPDSDNGTLSATIGTLSVQLGQDIITVCRVRGGPLKNDLYWLEKDLCKEIRGKDATETQRLLNERLGVNSYIYSLGSYYNEFSPSSTFFTARAIERRHLFESIADLSLPTILTKKIAESKKETTKQVTSLEAELVKIQAQITQLESSKARAEKVFKEWESQKRLQICDMEKKKEKFESTKAHRLRVVDENIEKFEARRVQDISESLANLLLISENISKCEACGHVNKDDNDKLEVYKVNSEAHRQRLSSVANPYLYEKARAGTETNIYVEMLEHLKNEENPHNEELLHQENDCDKLRAEHLGIFSKANELHVMLSSLEQLAKLVELLRAELMVNTIKKVESDTNSLLETYFYSEVRVGFDIQSKDRVDVTAKVSGNECPYGQLSKGQRSLVKFAFSIAVMSAASNNCGVKFDTVFLDEPLDGADGTLKSTAFNVFSMMATKFDSVMVIDHDENLKTLFDRRFLVEIEGSVSSIKEQS